MCYDASRHGGRKSRARECVYDPNAQSVRSDSEAFGETCFDNHSDCDCFAMQDAVLENALDRMRDRVAVSLPPSNTRCCIRIARAMWP